MLFLILVMTMAFTNVIADIEDDMEECARFVDFDDLEKIMEIPGYNELEKLCPVGLGYMDCVENVIKDHTGFSMAQLQRYIDDAEASAFITMFNNIRNLAEDLCNEDSQLNKDYRTHSECYKKEDKSVKGLCRKAADAAVEASEEFENEIHENAGEMKFDSNKECMIEAYDAVCEGIAILEECGEDAFNTFRLIIKRSTFFKYSVCTENQLELAKRKFLRELEIEESQKELYNLAFDIKRRRK